MGERVIGRHFLDKVSFPENISSRKVNKYKTMQSITEEISDITFPKPFTPKMTIMTCSLTLSFSFWKSGIPPLEINIYHRFIH